MLSLETLILVKKFPNGDYLWDAKVQKYSVVTVIMFLFILFTTGNNN